ncbi:MAG: PQQ-binding-like beta-propeller repeat protein, partial [Planctomycetales bacterium]|nr:PQQ-binding-like beta-propeller repeat protein [Planctomycetales bacterium]
MARGSRRYQLLPIGLVVVLTLVALPGPAFAQEVQTLADLDKLSPVHDWPWWRGPLRNGIAVPQQPPVEFGPQQAVKWRSKVPGRGHSSPIVVGKQVFLATADEGRQVQSVLAFDRSTGRQLWQKEVSRGGFPEKNHPKNTEASSTLACDGERLFATFFHHKTVELVALTLDGNIAWRKTAGAYNPRKYEYGYAPSPLLYRGTVIVTAEYDGDSFIAAFQRDSGEEVWRIKRPNNITFSSPVVATVSGKDQMFISGAEKVVSYDPATGRQLWSVDGTTFATCGTMIWDGDIVIASGGYPKAETIAIRADGSGTIVWRNNQKCYEQSMIVVNGYIYALTDNGILFCWRSNDGKQMWRTRLKGPVSASPVLADNAIYWANELGTLYVFRPNPEKFELLAENQIGDSSFASPAIVDGQIFLRVA